MFGKCSTTNNEATSNRVLRETSIKIDLHMQEVPQNAVLEDQRSVTKIQDLVHMLSTLSRTESAIADLRKQGEFKDIKLFELGEVSTQVQCPSCAKMCKTFERTETQDEGIICRSVNFLLHCERERIIREVQSMDDAKNGTIISKRMNQRDTR